MNLINISTVNITSKYHSVKSITLNMVHSRVDMDIIGLMYTINDSNIIDTRSVINKFVIYF